MQKKTRSKLLSECIELFREWKGAGNVSPKTIATYMMHIRHFFRWAGDRPIGEIDDELVLRYIVGSRSQYAPSTIAYRAIALRQFFGYMERKRWINFAADLIPVPGYQSKHFYTPTHEEMRQTIANVQGSDFTAMRDRCLLLFLYATGVRVSEAQSMNVEDYDPEKTYASVESKKHRKRGKVRMVVWDDFTHSVLREYLQMRQLVARSNALFIAVDKQHWGKRLTTRSMQRIVVTHRANPRMSPHTIRHRYGTDLAQAGVYLRTAADLMGHLRMESTANIYQDLDDAFIINAAKKVFKYRKTNVDKFM